MTSESVEVQSRMILKFVFSTGWE